MDIYEIRLRNARLLAQNCKLNEFAERIGKPATQVSRFMGKGASKNIGPQIAREIEQAFGKPRGWLDRDHLQEIPHALGGKIEPLSLKVMRTIPVKSAAQILRNETGEEVMVLIGEHAPEVFGYRHETDEMQGLRGEFIRQGSVLVINPTATPKQGDVVLAEVDGGLVLGHYSAHGGVPKVRPSNDQYAATDISGGRVIGVATQWTYAP